MPENIETVTIKLYNNIAERNRVNKEQFLTYLRDVKGTFRDEVSVFSMLINIYTDNIDFNYIYIEEFNRYYFVEDFTVIRTNMYELSVSIDVLYTYKDSILNLKGFIDRNESKFNERIIDKKRIITQGVTVEDYQIANAIFLNDGTDVSSYNDNIYVLNGFMFYVSDQPYTPPS